MVVVGGWIDTFWYCSDMTSMASVMVVLEVLFAGDGVEKEDE